MKFFMKILVLLSFFVLVAEAWQWKLRDMDFKYTDSIHERFIYVPDGEYFYQNFLVGDIYGSDYHSYAEIYLDDKLIKVFSLRNKKHFKVRLPSMKSGFHKITILGLPDTLVLSIKDLQENWCPKMRELPYGLENVFLDFQSKIVSPPKMNRYQEVFFNPAFPSKKPLLASLVFDKETPAVLSAVMRMIGGIKTPMRGIHYIMGESNTTDFSLVFKKLTKEDEHKASIRIERHKKVFLKKEFSENEKDSIVEQPARLTFYYRDEGMLLESINALLNTKYLKPLNGNSIDINTSVEEPEWGILKNYKTLQELGVRDTKLTGNGKTYVLLNYPVYWQPTDRLYGSILIRSQVALPQNTHINIWLNNVLSGSESVAYFKSNNIQHVFQVDGLYIPKKNIVKLEFDTVLNTRKICEDPIPGTMWVSADKSWIEMPHRQKTGIMGLLPALVAKPTLSLSPVTTGTLCALATFIQEEQTVTFNKPLAYNVTQSKDATLEVLINKNALEKFFNQNRKLLNSILVSRSVWLHTKGDGKLKVIAANESSLENLDRVWKKVMNEIVDGSLDVVIDTQSEALVITKIQRDLKEPENIKISNSEYKYSLIIVGVLFILLVVWLLSKSFREGINK